MHCTNCGSPLGEGARFCPACGHEVGKPINLVSAPRRLVRPRVGRKIAGVCAGFAQYLNWDVTLVRILWLALVLGAGTGLIAYLIAWAVLPNSD